MPVLHLLPALPKAWPSGEVKGLRARGGFEVDITWRDEKLTSARIRSLQGNPAAVRYRERTVPLALRAGETIVLPGDLPSRP